MGGETSRDDVRTDESPWDLRFVRITAMNVVNY